MSKLALVLLGTSSVALGSTSLYLMRQLHVERENAQTLRAEVGKLEQRIASAQQAARVEPPVPAMQEVVAPPAKPAASESPHSPATGTASFVSARLAPVAAASIAFSSSGPANLSREESLRIMRENAERQRTLLQNPEYREAMLLQQKATLPRQYPGLEETLDISADQYEQLVNTLANQSMRAMENQNVAFDGSGDPAAAERSRAKWQQQLQRNESELRAVLGDKYQAWKDYQSNMPGYHQVNELRTTLAENGLTLDKDQAQALVKTFSAEQQRLMQEYARDASLRAKDPARNSVQVGSLQSGMIAYSADQQETQLKRLAESQQRIRDAAASILTPEQLRQLELEQNQQLQMREASIRLMRAQAEASASSSH